MAACINLDLYIYSEAYSETCQISTMELLAKIFKPNSHVRTFCRKSLRLKPYSLILFFTLKFYVHVRGGSRLQIRLWQSSVIKAPISFLNMHKLLWKSKILVHDHVRIFLNFVTFPLTVLIKIVEVIKNIFFRNWVSY